MRMGEGTVRVVKQIFPTGKGDIIDFLAWLESLLRSLHEGNLHLQPDLTHY